MKTKMNTLLAKTDHLGSSFKKMVEEYMKYFKNKQGDFRGEKKTYVAKDGTIDIPSERRNDRIVATVGEKFEWFEKSATDYIDALFAQEATNASGSAKAKLVVDGTEFGEFSSLELLRLKSLLESGHLEEMYKNIPTRSDSEEWKKTGEEMYEGRDIFESPKNSGTKKSTTKESYILPDPNIEKAGIKNYTPQIASRDTIIELGEYTHQRFSGEFSHRERAEILKRRTQLLTAVIEALKVANEAEAVSSDMNASKLFGFLHNGGI
jgi:hypothetical protein